MNRREFPLRTKKRSAPSVAGAASRSLAPATWPSTLGLPRAPRAPLQPPQLPRVSTSPGPSLAEVSGPLRAETLRLGVPGVSCRGGDFRASAKGGRRGGGPGRTETHPGVRRTWVPLGFAPCRWGAGETGGGYPLARWRTAPPPPSASRPAGTLRRCPAAPSVPAPGGGGLSAPTPLFCPHLRFLNLFGAKSRLGFCSLVGNFYRLF